MLNANLDDIMFNIKLLILMLFSLIIMPIIISEILSVLGNYTKQFLVDNYGENSQIIIGGLGVIIHELAHFLIAIAFCHHINKLNLLAIKSYKRTNSLGYVNHSWNSDNIYESLGNFFIGLAPCFICSQVLWLFHKYLFNSYTSVQNLKYVYTWTSSINTAFKNVIHPSGSFSWTWILYFVLIIAISSTGYGLSKADNHNALSGLPYWFISVVIMYVLIIIFGLVSFMNRCLWILTTIWLIFLGRGIIYLFCTLISLYLLHKIWSYI